MKRILLAAHILLIAIAAADPLTTQLIAQLPPDMKPTVILSQADATGLGVSGEGVVSSVVAGKDPVFTNARQVRVPAGFSAAWKAGLHIGPISQPITKGHVILAAFWMRAPEVSGGRSGMVQAYLERNQPSWLSLGESGASCTRQWQQVFIAGQAKEDFAAGTIQLSLHLGQQEQVLEIGGVVILDLGTGVDPARLPRNAIFWPGMEADAPWRLIAAQSFANADACPDP